MIRVGPPLLRLFMASVAALGGGAIEAQDAGIEGEARAQAENPDAAAEGGRDLEKLKQVFAKLLKTLPYGRSWRALHRAPPAPPREIGVGDATSHDALKNDPMEIQEQPQYLESAGVEVRHGFAILRGVRVFRFGKLRGLRIVIEPAGRVSREAFLRDFASVVSGFEDPLAALGAARRFQVKRNDLVDQKEKRPSAWPEPPLVIDLEPRERRAR